MNNLKCDCIIPAAGTGSRMGSINKQFIDLDGIPIIIRTIKKFEECDLISKIIVGISENCEENLKSILKNYDIKKTIISYGGNTRQETIYNALKKVDEDTDIVVVSDAVRPFVEIEEIEEVIKVAKENGTAILVTPLNNTIKEKNDKIRTLDRNNLWNALTPQAFKKDIIINAYENAKKLDIIATDDSSLVEKLNIPISFILGNSKNIKITTVEDLEYAKFLIKDTQKNTKTIIYTDGACTDNPGPGGYAAVILTENERIEISKGFKRTTNNRMELLSVISALEELKTKSKVDLYSDSKYVVDAINRNWLNNWIKNNWIKSDKRRVMNMDLWKQLIPLIKKHDVNFIWLRGHNNVNENERCDQLAKEAAKNPQFEDI